MLRGPSTLKLGLHDGHFTETRHAKGGWATFRCQSWLFLLVCSYLHVLAHNIALNIEPRTLFVLFIAQETLSRHLNHPKTDKSGHVVDKEQAFEDLGFRVWKLRGISASHRLLHCPKLEGS